MKIAPMKSLIIFCTAILLLNACGEGNVNSNQNSNGANNAEMQNSNANVAKDNVAELSNLINSPFEFEDSSVWRELNPSPNERKLIVVLNFKTEDAEEIVKRAETYKPALPAELDAESWFPPELIAQSGASGDETIKGKSYAANDFVKSPFTGGKLIRITDTDYFVLELTTK